MDLNIPHMERLVSCMYTVNLEEYRGVKKVTLFSVSVSGGYGGERRASRVRHNKKHLAVKRTELISYTFQFQREKHKGRSHKSKVIKSDPKATSLTRFFFFVQKIQKKDHSQSPSSNAASASS